jgi:hypothetical protein
MIGFSENVAMGRCLSRVILLSRRVGNYLGYEGIIVGVGGSDLELR